MLPSIYQHSHTVDSHHPMAFSGDHLETRKVGWGHLRSPGNESDCTRGDTTPFWLWRASVCTPYLLRTRTVFWLRQSDTDYYQHVAYVGLERSTLRLLSQPKIEKIRVLTSRQHLKFAQYRPFGTADTSELTQGKQPPPRGPPWKLSDIQKSGRPSVARHPRKQVLKSQYNYYFWCVNIL